MTLMMIKRIQMTMIIQQNKGNSISNTIVLAVKVRCPLYKDNDETNCVKLAGNTKGHQKLKS